MANSHVDMFTARSLDWRHYMDPQFPASNETVSFFASTYTTSSCKLNFPSFGNKNTSYSFEMFRESWFAFNSDTVNGFQNQMHIIWIICVFIAKATVLGKMHSPKLLCNPRPSIRRPATSWFPQEPRWRHRRCKDQLPWSSGKIQYLTSAPSQVEISLIDRADWTPPYRENLPHCRLKVAILHQMS